MTDEHVLPAGRIPLPAPIPYIESLGAELLEMADGKAVAEMTPAPEHINSWGVVHGGVLMTLLDFAMAMASRSAWRPASPTDEGRNLTVEMKTTFMRPGRGRLTIAGRCLQAGRTLSFCEAEITDAEGAIVARASGTFKFWSKR